VSLLGLAPKANANCILRLGNSPIRDRKHGGFAARNESGQSWYRWGKSPGMDMLAQLTRAFESLEHEFQSELDEARVRAEANYGYLAEG